MKKNKEEIILEAIGKLSLLSDYFSAIISNASKEKEFNRSILRDAINDDNFNSGKSASRDLAEYIEQSAIKDSYVDAKLRVDDIISQIRGMIKED